MGMRSVSRFTQDRRLVFPLPEGPTSAVILPCGYVDRMPESLWDSGRALSIHIYDLSMNVPGGDSKAYASALILILILIMTNSMATWIGNNWLSRHLRIA